jgi:hypothetical protein
MPRARTTTAPRRAGRCRSAALAAVALMLLVAASSPVSAAAANDRNAAKNGGGANKAKNAAATKNAAANKNGGSSNKAKNAPAAAANKPASSSLPPRRPAAPLASSAILFYTAEYSRAQFGEARTRCEQLVDNAWAEGGSDSLNFVPTISATTPAPDGIPVAKSGPRATCKPENWHTITTVDAYCYKATWDAPCLPPTKADIEEFTSGFSRCAAYAARLGFRQILMSPHIDDAEGKGLWRNMIDFNPLKADKHGNSYWSILLEPTLKAGMAAAQAAAQAGAGARNGANTPFTLWLGLQGEMGRPVFSDPAAWSETATKAREVWATQNLPSSAARLSLGVMFAYRSAVGANIFGLAPESEPLQEPSDTPLVRLGGSEKPLPFDQWPVRQQMVQRAPALATLFRRDLDFLGISNYLKSGPQIAPQHFDKAFKTAADEIKTASVGEGLDVSAMARGVDAERKAAGKAPLVLMWSEFGIGGSGSRCGDRPAKTAADAARWPHSGIYSSWTAESDPWAGPNASPGLKEYRRAFHSAALKFLAEGGSADFPLHSAYLWSLTSWDPQAVHPASRAPGGAARTGYWDGEIAGAIKAHNEMARGQQ